MYMLSQPVNVVYSIGKYPRLDSVSDIYLWHCRLGHIKKNRINKLTQEEILEVSDCKSLPTCESYLLDKMTKSSFTEKDERAIELLDLVILMYAGPWVQVLEVDISTSSLSWKIYLDMDMSIWWNISRIHLKCSNDSEVK